MFKSIKFLGHSAVVIETSGGVVAIDPWLEGNPLCPETEKKPQKIDTIILTHGHADHSGDAVRIAKLTGATIVATWELAMIMMRLGISESQVIAMNKGGTVEHQGVKISLTHAMHSSSFDLPDGPVYAGEPVGVVLSIGNTSIYHAGDTALFSDMALIRDRYKPSISILPIGDRFTMGPEEAALAAKLVGAKTNIAIHYGTFPILTGTFSEFHEHCSRLGVKAIELPVGERKDIVKFL